MKSGDGLSAITLRSTSVMIADQLRERIVDGYFQPGEQINEAQVAGQLNVSRGPVREALQRLSQEGLLVSKPNRGVFVIELERSDVDEVYQVREILEVAAAEILVQRDDATRKQVMKQLLQIADQIHAAVKKDDWRDVSRLDLQFHTSLVKASGNSRLLRAYTTLAAESRIVMSNLEQAYPDPVVAGVMNHQSIAELIGSGSLDEIREAFHSHLSAAEDHVVAGISATTS